MKLSRYSALVIAGMLLTSGCGKKDSDAEKSAEAAGKSAEAANQAAEAAAKSAQQMAQGGASTASKTPGVAVPAKTLAGFLATPSGYSIEGEPETMEMEMNGAKYSHATANYKNSDKNIKISILDYNYIAGLTAAYTAMMNMNMETNDESWHTEKIGGFPAWTDWKKKSNEGTIGVVVNDRVFVIVEAHGGATLDDLKSAASGVNFAGIASAAK